MLLYVRAFVVYRDLYIIARAIELARAVSARVGCSHYTRAMHVTVAEVWRGGRS